jgi:hypothetical protein
MRWTFTGVCGIAWAALAAAACGQEHPASLPPPRVELASPVVRLPMGSFGHRPVVEATLDGKGPYRFILDTGASGCVLAAPFADRAGLTVLAAAKVKSPESPTPVDGKLVRIERVAIGGITLTGLNAVAMDLSRVFPGPGDPVGVLSAALFPGYLLTFDYPAGTIALRAGELPAANGEDLFEFNPSRRLPSLSASFAGTAIDLDLDTGSATGFTVPSDYAARLPLSGGLVEGKPDKRVDRILTVQEGRLQGAARIGRFAFESPTIRFVAGTAQGLVGWDVLKRFAVTFDSKNHRLRLAEP